MAKNNKPLTQLIAAEERLKPENEKSPRAKRAKAGTGTVERLQKDSEAIQKNPPRPRKNEMPAETVVNPAAPVPAKKREFDQKSNPANDSLSCKKGLCRTPLLSSLINPGKQLRGPPRPTTEINARTEWIQRRKRADTPKKRRTLKEEDEWHEIAQDPYANRGGDGGSEDEDGGYNSDDNNNNNNNSNLDSDDDGGDGDYHGGDSGEDDHDSDVFMADATGGRADAEQEQLGYCDDRGSGGDESDFHSEGSVFKMAANQRGLKSDKHTTMTLDEGGSQEPVYNNQSSHHPYDRHLLTDSDKTIKFVKKKQQEQMESLDKYWKAQEEGGRTNGPKPRGGNSGGSQNRHGKQDGGQQRGQDGGRMNGSKPQGENSGGSQNRHGKQDGGQQRGQDGGRMNGSKPQGENSGGSQNRHGKQDGGKTKRPQAQEQRKSATATETTETARQTGSKQMDRAQGKSKIKKHGATGGKIQGQGPHESEDVLARHRQANKAVKAPNPKNLEDFRRKQQASDGGNTQQVAEDSDDSDDRDDSDNGEEEDQDVDGKERKTRTAQALTSAKERFFSKDWRKVIRRTKDMTLIALIISDLFPGEEFKDTDLPKLLTDAIAHFENTTDMELSPDIYRKHKENILDILWNNISTFRTRIKDKAEAIVKLHYAPDIIAKPDFERDCGQAEAEAEAEYNVKALVDRGLYHHSGKDANARLNRTNNFMAPALEALCREVLEMTPNCLIQNYPDEFNGAYPLQFIAAMCTYLVFHIKRYSTGTLVERRFTEDEQRAEYDGKVELLKTMEKNEPYHWNKSRAEWAKWSEKVLKENGKTRIANSSDGAIFD
ncbi:hypothetical protein B0H14DRAFT_3499043 [Mycena olivaceomarginata]|nr:hypothetical protein B0H14DRAFT_3499043 [Mycena olivaceomarginata]